jgi:hypothetical protein
VWRKANSADREVIAAWRKPERHRLQHDVRTAARLDSTAVPLFQEDAFIPA